MDNTENLIIVHNGALGDFLCGFSAINSIYEHYSAAYPKIKNFWFWGRDFSFKWLEPLGFSRPDSYVISALEGLYISNKWPQKLNNCKIFWFCLDGPVVLASSPNLVSLPILRNNENNENVGVSYSSQGYLQADSLSDATQAAPLVVRNLALQLRSLGIEFKNNLAVKQKIFGAWHGQHSTQIALLHGAGHRSKEWPLEKFNTLAARFKEEGWEPVFLLGPVEEERKKDATYLAKKEYVSPPAALAERLAEMRMVVAPDAGPAHLASMLGMPGVVLFGATNHNLWAPEGLELILPKNVKGCAPMVDDPKNIDSSLPSAVANITVEDVLQKCNEILQRK